MRRLLALFTACAVLALGGVIAGTLYLQRARANVIFTEQTVYGDPAEAADASLSFRAHLDYHLFWDVNVSLGAEPRTDADFRYYSDAHYPDYNPIRTPVSLYNEFPCQLDTDSAIETLSPLDQIIRELYDSAPIGREVEYTVRLADLYDYYPIAGNLFLDGMTIGWDEHTVEYYSETRGIALSAFADFFKIPVQADDVITLSLLRQSETSTQYGISQDTTYNFYTVSGQTENAFYLAINNQADGDRIIDTSEIPGGYGLYCVPLTVREKNTIPLAEEMYMCYPLSEDTHVFGIYADPTGERLCVFASEGTTSPRYTMTLIDCATMTELQHIVLSDSVYGYVTVFQAENCFALYLGEERIILLAQEDSGLYTVMLDTPFSPGAEKLYSLSSSAVIHWDGTRLLVTDFYDTFYNQSTNFYLAVYKAEGLVYYGNYTCSLSVGEDKDSVASISKAKLQT